MTLRLSIRGVLGQYWFYRDIRLVLVTQAGALVFWGKYFTYVRISITPISLLSHVDIRT